MTEVSSNTHRTAEVPLEITCPIWCTESPEFHLQELSGLEAQCIHPMPWSTISDAEGFKPWGGKRRYASPIDVWISVITDLKGKGTEPAVVFVDGKELTVAQALELSEEIHNQVQLYRSTGGKA